MTPKQRAGQKKREAPLANNAGKSNQSHQPHEQQTHPASGVTTPAPTPAHMAPPLLSKIKSWWTAQTEEAKRTKLTIISVLFSILFGSVAFIGNVKSFYAQATADKPVFSAVSRTNCLLEGSLKPHEIETVKKYKYLTQIAVVNPTSKDLKRAVIHLPREGHVAVWVASDQISYFGAFQGRVDVFDTPAVAVSNVAIWHDKGIFAKDSEILRCTTEETGKLELPLVSLNEKTLNWNQIGFMATMVVLAVVLGLNLYSWLQRRFNPSTAQQTQPAPQPAPTVGTTIAPVPST